MEFRIPKFRLWPVLFAAAVLGARELAFELLFGSAADWLESNLGILGDLIASRWAPAVLVAIILGLWWASSQVAERRRVAVGDGGSVAPAAPEPRPSVEAEKGFLDFWVDAKKAGEELPRILVRITKETRGIGEKVRGHAERWQAVKSDAEKAHRVASNAARDIDGYSEFIEESLESLQNASRLLTEGWIGYIELSPEAASNKTGVLEFRGVVEVFLGTTRNTRKSVATFRNSVSRLKERRLSQEMNRATQRLTADLESVVAIMKDIERSCVRLVSLIDSKLRD